MMTRIINRVKKKAAKDKHKLVIVTHHAPTFENTSDPAFADSDIKAGFSTSLEHMMQNDTDELADVHTWICGQY